MRLLLATVAACAAFVLNGCGTVPPLQSVPDRTPSQQLARGQSLTIEQSHIHQYLREDRSLVYGQVQGGSLALGLIAGPLGVLANMKNIETNTMNDMARLRGKVLLDPPLAFQQAVTASGVALRDPAAPGDLRITPWVMVFRTTPATVEVSARLVIEPLPAAAQIRQLPVVMQLPTRYTFEEFESLSPERYAAMQAEIVKAYAAMLRFVSSDQQSRIAAEQKIIVTTAPAMFPVYDETDARLISDSNDQVWLRLPSGIYAGPSAQFKYRMSTR